ncbi:MAG: purine-nucleoside phosphorylase [Clostridia bacterium]|nr:purine-nucleoside phosphorylase [Clostridia bacterium]
MSTPHNEARPGDFAKTVLMPGDPLRAKTFAERYLENRTLVNNCRGIQGYTGFYKGKRVSIMASGMGMPSMGIYSYELFTVYDVDNIIRVGTAGALSGDIPLRSLVIAAGACTDSNFAAQYNLPGTFAPIASYELLKKAADTARELNLPHRIGNVLSSDVFYSGLMDEYPWKKWIKMGVLAVEMETAALYMTAAFCGKNALAMCTVSDSIATGERCTVKERQNTFDTMMEIALSMV